MTTQKITTLAGIISIIALISVVFVISSINKPPEIANTAITAGGNVPSLMENKEKAVREFIMESFVELTDGKPKPQFSLKEITVKKGDLVRLKITVTKGTHDFKIDEFEVYADTPLNQETVVEFVADKTGEFIYYCTKPGHRQAGHWGTLKVIE